MIFTRTKRIIRRIDVELLSKCNVTMKPCPVGGQMQKITAINVNLLHKTEGPKLGSGFLSYPFYLLEPTQTGQLVVSGLVT